MKYIIAGTLALSMIFLSGCRFSAWDWGWVTDNTDHKTGFIDTDLHQYNALNNYEDKQKAEEFNKKNGFVFGFLITKEF